MPKERTKWVYVRLSCQCVRSVSQVELATGTAVCFGRFARSKEQRRRDIVHILTPGRHIKPYRCDQDKPLEALDANGDPLYPMDSVVVLGTLGTVKHLVQRIEQRPLRAGEMETVLVVESGPPILPCTVRKAESEGKTA